jgi:hypothetical protein
LNLNDLFIRSHEFRNCSNDALSCYLVLRHDCEVGTTSQARTGKEQGKLRSGLTPTCLSEIAGVPEVIVKTCIEELCKRKWTRRCDGNLDLGYIEDYEAKWFLDQKLLSEDVEKIGLPKSLASAEKIRRKIEKDKESFISDKTKSTIKRHVGLETKDMSSKDVLQKYRDLYKDKYSTDAPLVEHAASANPFAASYVYISRALKWTSSGKEFCSLMSFTFDNWNDIRGVLGLDGRPTLNIFGSSKLMPRLLEFKSNGIPERKKYDKRLVVDRYEESDSDDTF